MCNEVLSLVNDRTRSLWAGTNGGHVYVYSLNGFESQVTNQAANASANTAAIATDQTSTCTMGESLSHAIHLRTSRRRFLAKEIRLKHKAPVLSIVVLDASNQPVGHGSNVPTIESLSTAHTPASNAHTTDAASPTSSSSTAATSHKVLICSEEQFKVRFRLLSIGHLICGV